LDQGTESIPSRIRLRGGSTGSPSSRSRSSIARQRTRGPKHPVARDAGPRAVGGGQQGVDRLAGDVVVDQHLGQPFGEVRRTVDRERIAGRRQVHRPISVHQHPATEAAELVACAVDDQPSRCQLPLHHRPCLANAFNRVLAQHVECAHQNRCLPG
jgi:hypothetical protein